MIEIKDDLIGQNTGIYRWEISERGSRVTKIPSDFENRKQGTMVPEISMHITEFTAWVLQDVFINEIV